jgi:hypothetical protein
VGIQTYQPEGPVGRHLALAGSILNLPWLLLDRLFITTTGGKGASDKYHKQGEKSRQPDQS